MTPFTGAILTVGKAGAARLCLHNKQCATRPAVKSARPSVARLGPPGALRCLPDAQGIAPHTAPTRAARYAP